MAIFPQIFQPQRPQLQPQHPSIVQHHHPLAVHQMYSPSGDAYQYHPKNRPDERMDDEEDNNFSGRQPLYANAPPKPRRLNTSRERDSPSPERLVYQVDLIFIIKKIVFHVTLHNIDVLLG